MRSAKKGLKMAETDKNQGMDLARSISGVKNAWLEEGRNTKARRGLTQPSFGFASSKNSTRFCPSQLWSALCFWELGGTLAICSESYISDGVFRKCHRIFYRLKGESNWEELHSYLVLPSGYKIVPMFFEKQEFINKDMPAILICLKERGASAPKGMCTILLSLFWTSELPDPACNPYPAYKFY